MSMKIYDEKKLISMVNRTGEAIFLSIIFTVSCIPLVTIGAALTALHYTSMKCLTSEDGNVWLHYSNCFKQKLKQSTIIWVILAILYMAAGINVLHWYHLNKTEGGIIYGGMLLISVIFAFLLTMIAIYIFPLLAKFDNSLRVQMKNAFILSIKNFYTTMIITVVLSIVAFLMYYRFWMCFVCGAIVGFGLLAFAYDYYMLRCLMPYLEVEVEEEASIDELVNLYKIPEEAAALDEPERDITVSANESEAQDTKRSKAGIVGQKIIRDEESVTGASIILEEVVEKEEETKQQESQEPKPETALPEAVIELNEKAKKAKENIEPPVAADNVYRRDSEKTRRNSQNKKARKQRKR